MKLQVLGDRIEFNMGVDQARVFVYIIIFEDFARVCGIGRRRGEELEINVISSSGIKGINIFDAHSFGNGIGGVSN